MRMNREVDTVLLEVGSGLGWIPLEVQFAHGVIITTM